MITHQGNNISINRFAEKANAKYEKKNEMCAETNYD